RQRRGYLLPGQRSQTGRRHTGERQGVLRHRIGRGSCREAARARDDRLESPKKQTILPRHAALHPSALGRRNLSAHAFARRLCAGDGVTSTGVSREGDMNWRLISIGAFTLVTSVAPQQQATPDWKGKNLQYFPKDITRDVLVQRMREFSFALSVRC